MRTLLASALILGAMTTTGIAAEAAGHLYSGDKETRLSEVQLDMVTAGIKKDLGVFFLPEPANRIPYDQVILIANPGTDPSLDAGGIVDTAQLAGGLGRLSTGRP